MFQSSQFELARLEHHHGGGDWHEMQEIDPHDSASEDPEREWPNAKIFRCKTCEAEIRVISPDPYPVENSLTGP